MFSPIKLNGRYLMKYKLFCMLFINVLCNFSFVSTQKDLEACMRDLPSETKKQIRFLVGYVANERPELTSRNRAGVYYDLCELWKHAKLPGNPNQHSYQDYQNWTGQDDISRPGSCNNLDQIACNSDY